MIPYKKSQLLEKLIAQIEQNSEMVARSAERVRQDSINAEGRMQTRYGSEKEETGYLADGLNQRNQEIQNGLSILRSLSLPQSPQRVERGCVVRLNDSQAENTDYFILPYGGGESLITEYGEVTILSPTAPLTRSMLNKTIGEQFSFGGQKQSYTVLAIQ